VTLGSARGLRERLVLQASTPLSVTLASVTRSGSTATATSTDPHNFTSNDLVTIAGATPSGYNLRGAVATVTGDRTFTYPVSSGLATPATGTITATYLGDGKGGQRVRWQTVDTLAAEEIPIRSFERLQAEAQRGYTLRRFRVRARADLAMGQRLLWTPTFPTGSARKVLAIVGLLPMDGDRLWMLIDASEASA
jgi:head-tail adaptor